MAERFITVDKILSYAEKVKLVDKALSAVFMDKKTPRAIFVELK
jgi:hypothetical protein